MAKNKPARNVPDDRQPSGSALPLFDRIYFDTEPLYAAGWPHLSVLLQNVASLANGLNISLHLPAAVYLELQARRLADYDAEFKAAQSRTSMLRARLKELGGDASQIPELPDVRTEMRNCYLASVESLKDTFLQTPTPALQFQDLLSNALGYELAFEQGDKGFKDTVIFLSAMEEVRGSSRPTTAVFVSQDGVFRKKKEHLEAWASSVGASLSLCENLEDIERALEHRQTTQIQEQIESERQALESALDQRLADVQHWLDRNVEFWNWQIVPFKIYKTEVLRLLSATSQHGSSRPEVVSVKVSFKVEATLLGSYLETLLTPSMPVSLSPSARSTSSMSTYSGRSSQFESYPKPTATLRRQMGRFSAMVEIDAEAILEAGGYSTFTFLAARIDQ